MVGGASRQVPATPPARLRLQPQLERKPIGIPITKTPAAMVHGSGQWAAPTGYWAWGRRRGLSAQPGLGIPFLASRVHRLGRTLASGNTPRVVALHQPERSTRPNAAAVQSRAEVSACQWIVNEAETGARPA
jgi:hypothetical protein